MAHIRKRHILAILLKRMKPWPVLGLLGARQVGKSTVLRDILTQEIDATYLTLDKKSLRESAQKTPEYFIETRLSKEKKTLMIDEIQKAPHLFDAIKANVDLERRPGKFIISGSTQFSKKIGIRESLTGRIGILRLYPMTIGEQNHTQFRTPWVNFKSVTGTTPKDIFRCLESGGMPGICFLRSAQERAASFESFLDSICYRDLQQFNSGLSGDLAREILEELASKEIESLTDLSRALGAHTRVIKKHIESLEALFVIHRVNPLSGGVGKSRYYLFDSGIATHLGAPQSMQVKIFTLNEILAQYEYSGVLKYKIHYYQSSKKSVVDFVIESEEKMTAIKISDEESPTTYSLRSLEAFLKKFTHAKGIVYAPSSEAYQIRESITLCPWVDMA